MINQPSSLLPHCILTSCTFIIIGNIFIGRQGIHHRLVAMEDRKPVPTRKQRRSARQNLAKRARRQEKKNKGKTLPPTDQAKEGPLAKKRKTSPTDAHGTIVQSPFYFILSINLI